MPLEGRAPASPIHRSSAVKLEPAAPRPPGGRKDQHLTTVFSSSVTDYSLASQYPSHPRNPWLKNPHPLPRILSILRFQRLSPSTFAYFEYFAVHRLSCSPSAWDDSVAALGRLLGRPKPSNSLGFAEL